MSDTALYRVNGALLILGGIAGIVAHVLHLGPPPGPGGMMAYTAMSAPVHVLLLVAVLLVMAGLPGLAAAHRERLSAVGLFGFVAVYFGIVFADMLHCVLEFAAFPVMAKRATDATMSMGMEMENGTILGKLGMFGAPLFLVGLIVLTVVVFRARVLPRWNAWLLALSPLTMVLALLPFTPMLIRSRFPVFFYLAMAGMGISLMSVRVGRLREALQPA